MQRRLMLAAGASAALVGLARGARAQAAQVLPVVDKSVVKVVNGGMNASGFLWPDASSVVTALHVVDGNAPVVVHAVNEHGQITKSIPATVARVQRDNDLALLALQAPFPGPPLRVAAGRPAVDDPLDALGFALNIPASSSTRLNVRFGGSRLEDILPPSALQVLGDYPSRQAEILNLEGNLVPGMSGAPIVNGQGEVVGVADGGIENGTLGRCWGIPAAALRALSSSADNRRPASGHAAALFSAETRADVRTLPPLGGVTLTKLRSSTFAQLSGTSDDVVGLSKMVNYFESQRRLDPRRFSYDIYQDLTSGASIAVPAGAVLRDAGGGFIDISVGDARVHMALHLYEARSMPAARASARAFEAAVSGPIQPPLVVLDPQWSYLGNMQRGNVLITRKTIVRGRPGPMGLASDKVYFETLASNGSQFLGVCAISEDFTPATRFELQRCIESFESGPRCDDLQLSEARFAQMVLGVQFSTFPVTGRTPFAA